MEDIIYYCIFLGILMIPVIILGKFNYRKLSKRLVLAIYINLFIYGFITISEIAFNHNIMYVSLLILELGTIEGFMLFLIDSFLLILALETFEVILIKIFHRKEL